MPYSQLAVKKSRRGGGGDPEVGGEDGENPMQESEDEGESLQTDAMIKVRVDSDGGGVGRLLLVVNRSFVLSPSQQKKAKVTKTTKEKEDSGQRKGKAKAKTRK